MTAHLLLLQKQNPTLSFELPCTGLVPSPSSMAKRIIPLLDRVLIEKIVPAAKSVGGVLLPESATTKVNAGKVIATGSGGRAKDGSLIPISVKEGDTVLLPEYGGTEVKIGDKELHIYRNDDLLGILTE